MLRTRLRLRAGGSGFSPSQINFTSGLWLDPSDISTGFQDSAGTTPQTATGQPTGKRLDKSGNGNHVLQATSGARPEYDVISGISSDFLDGSDDGYSTNTFTAGTLVADMDCLIAIKRASAVKGMLVSATASGAGWVGTYDPGSASASNDSIGVLWSYWVNGVQVGSTGSVTRGQLESALTVGSWVVMEARNLNLSGATWTQFRVSQFTGFPVSGDIGGVILCPAQSSTDRTKLRKWLGAKVGLSL